MKRAYLLIGIALAVTAILALVTAGMQNRGWTKEELATLEGLWLGSLEPLPADPSNRYADDPRAAELGHKLFFDTRFSASGEVAKGWAPSHARA